MRESHVLVTSILKMKSICWLLLLVFSLSTSKSFELSSIKNIKRDLKSSIDDASGDATTNTTRAEGEPTKQTTKKSISKSEYAPANGDIRFLNEYTRHTVLVQSLTQELYGIIDFPEGTTTTTFQEIHDEYVQSYFSLNVDPSLLLKSHIKITNVIVPSMANRYIRRQLRNLEILQAVEGKYEGSSVTIAYDQQISYYFPSDSGLLALESLVTLPFLTESGRNEFNSKLKSSNDFILQDVVGVSEVDLQSRYPAAQPTSSQPQIPVEPVTEVGSPPQLSINQPIYSTKKPTERPANSPTASPSMRSPPAPPGQTPSDGVNPTSIPTKLPASSPPPKSPVSSPSPIPTTPPTNAPVFVPTKTARPTLVSTKADTLDTDSQSEGFSGLIVIGSLMVVLFAAFTINMKYCMGEYVD